MVDFMISIDFHSHILPAMDDGAKDVIESTAMARVASEKGINIIVATPHFIYGDTTYKKQHVIEKVEALNKELQRENIPLEILPGQEVYLCPEIPNLLKNNEIITMGDKGKYILVELPMHEYPNYTEKTLFEIMLQGVVPIIAHPERNRVFAKHPSMLYTLITKGILAQGNIGSFHGHYGAKAKEVADIFLKHNYYHFLGFDAHSIEGYEYDLPGDFDYSPGEKAFRNNTYLATAPLEIKEKKKFLGLF